MARLTDMSNGSEPLHHRNKIWLMDVDKPYQKASSQDIFYG